MCNRPTQNQGGRWVVPIVTLIILASGSGLVWTLRIDPLRYQSQTLRKKFQLHETLHMLLIGLSLATYYRTHLTVPGSTKDWAYHRPDLIHPDVSLTKCTISASCMEEAIDRRLPAQCIPCQQAKPQRMHHCSVCNTCILRFDHHCQWMSACIGLLNAKFFLQFLLYTTCAAIHSTWVLLTFIRDCARLPTKLRHQFDVMMTLAVLAPVLLLLVVVVGILLGWMLVWNVRLALRNETALERWRRRTTVAQASAQGEISCETGGAVHQECPYSVSALANLRHLLGWNMALWLIPVKQSRARPCTKYDNDSKWQWFW